MKNLVKQLKLPLFYLTLEIRHAMTSLANAIFLEYVYDCIYINKNLDKNSILSRITDSYSHMTSLYILCVCAC
jgi:hypothetical protein